MCHWHKLYRDQLQILSSGLLSPWHGTFFGGGDGLQIWRVAANILNKQLQTTDKGWSSSLEIG